MKESYRIAVFAYNEGKNIARAIKGIFASFHRSSDLKVFIISNGCTDNTVDVVRGLMPEYPQIELIELELGDKCNAWNTYVYEYADDSFCHFFTDADVICSQGSFQLMMGELVENKKSSAVTGFPLSGWNRKTYARWIVDYHFMYGNLYGIKTVFLNKVKEAKFRFPIGLMRDDDHLTEILHHDMDKINNKQDRNRIVFNSSAGYRFIPLSPFRPHDMRIYFNRIIRYKLGKMQNNYLDQIPYAHWPENMDSINCQILNDLKESNIPLTDFISRIILRRLHKKYGKS